MCIYIYIYTHTYVCMYIYIYDTHLHLPYFCKYPTPSSHHLTAESRRDGLEEGREGSQRHHTRGGVDLHEPRARHGGTGDGVWESKSLKRMANSPKIPADLVFFVGCLYPSCWHR